MAAKKRVTPAQTSPSPAVPSATAGNTAPIKKDTTATSTSTASVASGASGPQILCAVWQRYITETPQRILLLDAFLLFLVAVGVVQFTYCVAVGNYPFNAFLAGFGAAVGQFVLTVSLRMQIKESSRKGTKAAEQDDSREGPSVSSERAFAEFIFGSVILHFFCVNFLN